MKMIGLNVLTLILFVFVEKENDKKIQHIDLNANEMPILKWARCHLNDIVLTIQTCFLLLLLKLPLPLITLA